MAPKRKCNSNAASLPQAVTNHVESFHFHICKAFLKGFSCFCNNSVSQAWGACRAHRPSTDWNLWDFSRPGENREIYPLSHMVGDEFGLSELAKPVKSAIAMRCFWCHLKSMKNIAGFMILNHEDILALQTPDFQSCHKKKPRWICGKSMTRW